MKLTFIVLILSVLLLAIESCKPDSATQEEDLVGEWVVVNAQRNGKATELVIGATFIFDETGSMITDITGKKDVGSFTLEDPLLVHHGANEVVYTLNKLTSDSLQIAVDLQGLNFVLDLVKQRSKK